VYTIVWAQPGHISADSSPSRLFSPLPSCHLSCLTHTSKPPCPKRDAIHQGHHASQSCKRLAAAERALSSGSPLYVNACPAKSSLCSNGESPWNHSPGPYGRRWNATDWGSTGALDDEVHRHHDSEPQHAGDVNELASHGSTVYSSGPP
jgi:hypothetical protein